MPPPKLPLLQSPSCSLQHTPNSRALPTLNWTWGSPWAAIAMLLRGKGKEVRPAARRRGPGAAWPDPPHVPRPTKASTKKPGRPHPTSYRQYTHMLVGGGRESPMAMVASLSGRTPWPSDRGEHHARRRPSGEEARSAWRPSRGKRHVWCGSRDGYGSNAREIGLISIWFWVHRAILHSWGDISVLLVLWLTEACSLVGVGLAPPWWGPIEVSFNTPCSGGPLGTRPLAVSV